MRLQFQSGQEARRQSDEYSAGKLDFDGINAMVDELEKQGVKYGEWVQRVYDKLRKKEGLVNRMSQQPS